MKLLSLSFLIMCFYISISHARRPAVEDFVGVEPETQLERAPFGAQTSYNFQKTDFNYNALTPFLVIFAFVTLPLFSWFFIVGQIKRNDELEESKYSNVAEISSNRKKVDDVDSDDDDDFKIAS